MPTDGVEFDTGDHSAGEMEPPVVPVVPTQPAAASQPIVAPYNPPQQGADCWDPEKGEAAQVASTTIPQDPVPAAQSSQPGTQESPVDLLDSSPTAPKADDALAGSIHELD